MSVSFSRSFRSDVASVSDSSNADVLIALQRNSDKPSAGVKLYSNAVSAFFGRIFSFIWHNSSNKSLKADYINDVVQRVGVKTPGRAAFIKTVEGLVNKSSGMPLQARIIKQIESELTALKAEVVKAPPSELRAEKQQKSKEAGQSHSKFLNIKRQLEEEASKGLKSDIGKKGHKIFILPTAPDISSLNEHHKKMLQKYVDEKKQSAPRASDQAIFWHSIDDGLKKDSVS